MFFFQKKNFRPAILTGAAILTGLLVSCEEYPEMEGDNMAQLVSWTYYEPDTNFTQYKTFFVEDSMGVIEEDQSTTIVQNARTRTIRNQIIECMENAGYVQTEDKDAADLYMTMMEVNQTNISISYDPGYWGGYDPWGWGYFYSPGYYYSPYYISSAYTTQTFSIQMGDGMHRYVNEDGNRVMTVVWNAVIKGITGYDRSDTEIQNAIRECFYQTDCEPFRTEESASGPEDAEAKSLAKVPGETDATVSNANSR